MAKQGGVMLWGGTSKWQTHLLKKYVSIVSLIKVKLVDMGGLTQEHIQKDTLSPVKGGEYSELLVTWLNNF